MPLVLWARRALPPRTQSWPGPTQEPIVATVCMGDRPQVRAAADPRLASRRGSEQTDQKLYSSHGALPNSEGRQV